jgi:hypothetical protein
MEKGNIKIKKKRNGEFKKELKVAGKEISIPKEFVFSQEYSGECEVEFENYKPIKIIIQGKEVPKSDAVIQAKLVQAENKQKQAEEEKKRKEVEERKAHKQKNQESQNSSKAENLYSINKTKLPKNTISILSNSDVIDNYALKLNKTVNFLWNEEKQREEATLFRKENKNKQTKELEKFEIPFDFKATKSYQEFRFG